MNWLTFLTLLIKLVLKVVDYLERRQIIKEVEASQLATLLERANDLIADAQRARSGVSSSDDELMLDPNNRANWPTIPIDKEQNRPDPPTGGV